MCQRERLVGKGLGAIDGGATGTVAVEKVAALNHERGDHAVELAAFVALGPAKGILGLAGAELAEVFGRFGDEVGEEFHLYGAEGLTCVGSAKGIES